MNGTEHPLQRTREPRPAVRTLLYVLFGPLVWAAHLTVIYGGQSVVCASSVSPPRTGASIDAVQTLVLIATIAALLALGAGWRWLPNPGGAMSESAEDRSHFLESVMHLLIVLSALGICGAGTAALVLPSCPALR